LGSLKETYDSEVTALKSKLDELTGDIALLKSNTGDRTTQLESAKKDIEKERDQIREELKATKEQLKKEKESLQKENDELQTNLNKGRKAREELEDAIAKEQEVHSQNIHHLRKHLLHHVQMMHTWKNLLEQDRKYESEDLHLDMEPQLDIYSFPNQIATLDIAIKEENEKLAALAVERKKKIKPVEGEKKNNIRQSGKTETKESSSSSSASSTTTTTSATKADKKKEKEPEPKKEKEREEKVEKEKEKDKKKSGKEKK